MRKLPLIALAVTLFTLLVSCGGRSTPTPDPTPTATGLDGQLLEGSTKVTSAAGDGLAGVEVELISRRNGQVTATTLTTADGRFSFRELPNGQFLLKLRFNSSADLDGDGLLDEIESYIPVEVFEDVVSLITAALDFDDSDGDSDDDAFKIDVRIKRGKNGAESHFIRVHRHRHGDTKVDNDGDGDIDDEYEDDDSNGLPDGTNGGGNYPQGPKLKGEIESLSDNQIVVDGETFLITDATRFRIRGNKDADPDDFEVGDEVQVTAFVNSDGDSVALEIKLKKNNGNGGGGGDDEDDEVEVTGVIEELTDTTITIAGETYNLTENTLFLLLDKTAGALSDFAIGDTVELKAKLVDGEWVVIRVKLEAEGSGDDEREVSGAIEAITATSVTVGGETFVLDAGTEFKLFSGDPGELADFTVGANVELTADLEGADWVVRVIRLTDEPPAELEDFVAHFTMFEPHVGQTLYLKVVDTATGLTVGTVTPFEVTSATFDVTLPTILTSGTDYTIDFWADVDGSGTLDATPIGDPVGVDHAWRLNSTADGDGIELTFMHDTNFTDIRPF
jgi:hypothetical protein